MANTTGYEVPEQGVNLLDARANIHFAIHDGNQGYQLLKYSKWSFQEIVFSRKSFNALGNEVFVSVTLGGFHRSWDKLSIQKKPNGRVFIVSHTQFMKALYHSQGNVPQTLSMVGGPLTKQKRTKGGSVRNFFIGTFLSCLAIGGLGYVFYNGTQERLLTDSRYQLREVRKEISRNRLKVGGHRSKIVSLREELTSLDDSYVIAKKRVRELEGLIKNKNTTTPILNVAKLEEGSLFRQKKRIEGEITRLRDELGTHELILQEQEQLSVKYNTLNNSTYWDWLKTWF